VGMGSGCNSRMLGRDLAGLGPAGHEMVCYRDLPDVPVWIGEGTSGISPRGLSSVKLGPRADANSVEGSALVNPTQFTSA
jgi:hypothetical protein